MTISDWNFQTFILNKDNSYLLSMKAGNHSEEKKRKEKLNHWNQILWLKYVLLGMSFENYAVPFIKIFNPTMIFFFWLLTKWVSFYQTNCLQLQISLRKLFLILCPYCLINQVTGIKYWILTRASLGRAAPSSPDGIPGCKDKQILV